MSQHPNVITLYDFFYAPGDKSLYLVFEPMEGDLYQLMKARRGRRMNGRLIFSLFHQIVSGLEHIHASGYFHRDMMPENVLITSTGISNYPPMPFSPVSSERDISVIVKLGDFGLAKAIGSTPPYTEFVSTRWYRAPEVLLNDRLYSSSVDMWAVGVIMVEVINLRPLFPGISQIDQISKICGVLGHPSDHGVDKRGMTVGGGPWNEGLSLARAMGFTFPSVRLCRMFRCRID
jgi:meiosis induction protein kinase IME2/SME1